MSRFREQSGWTSKNWVALEFVGVTKKNNVSGIGALRSFCEGLSV